MCSDQRVNIPTRLQDHVAAYVLHATVAAATPTTVNWRGKPLPNKRADLYTSQFALPELLSVAEMARVVY